MAIFVDYEQLKKDPAKVTGALLRAQYDDYLQRFAPIEQSLYDMTTYNNPGLVQQEIAGANGADGYVTQALQSGLQQQQRSNARFGINLTAEQQAAQQKANSLQSSLTQVDAANTIRRNLAERDEQIMIGATPNSGRAYSLKTTA